MEGEIGDIPLRHHTFPARGRHLLFGFLKRFQSPANENHIRTPRAKPAAMAFPMPVPAPVTMVVFRLKSNPS
jgi:hypothetical protein